MLNIRIDKKTHFADGFRTWYKVFTSLHASLLHIYEGKILSIYVDPRCSNQHQKCSEYTRKIHKEPVTDFAGERKHRAGTERQGEDVFSIFEMPTLGPQFLQAPYPHELLIHRS